MLRNPPKGPVRGRKTPDHGGFVLPTVLIFLAIFSLIILTVAISVRQGQNLAQRFSDQAKLRTALSAAEAHLSYIWLSSPAADYGVEILSNRRDDFAGILDIEPPAAEETGPVWRADGSFILFQSSEVDVYVSYRDVLGLISLTSTDSALLKAWLEGRVGISTSESTRLIATLRDYTDEDDQRRFQGAERADYRQRNRPAPTNSPLRNHAELGSILGWDQVLTGAGLRLFEETTLAAVGPEPVDAFELPIITALKEDEKTSLLSEGPDSIFATDVSLRTRPSPRGRFHLTAMLNSTGQARTRIIELERKPSAPVYPAFVMSVHEYSHFVSDIPIRSDDPAFVFPLFSASYAER